jgi:hypothetical protein
MQNYAGSQTSKKCYFPCYVNRTYLYKNEKNLLMYTFDKHLLADEIPANSWVTVHVSKIIYLKKNQ